MPNITLPWLIVFIVTQSLAVYVFRIIGNLRSPDFSILMRKVSAQLVFYMKRTLAEV
jgi:hypothetical protein